MIDINDDKNLILSNGNNSPKRKQKDNQVVNIHKKESTDKDIIIFMLFGKSKKYALSFSILLFILEFGIDSLKPSFDFTLIYSYLPDISSFY